MAPARDYSGARSDVRDAIGGSTDVMSRLRIVADLLWDRFSDAGVSWGGFYLPDPDDDSRLVLGPSRNKPACSPIGFDGACGWSWVHQRTLIVTDVAHLGDGYIACDPRDLSEIVIPVGDAEGGRIGVLDLDSFDRGSFDASDAAGLIGLLEAAGFSVPAMARSDHRTV